MSVKDHYKAYILRYWSEKDVFSDQETPWRFVLEEVASKKRHGYTSLNALKQALQEELKKEEKTCSEPAALGKHHKEIK